jgi:type II secretory pathway pseudopilin PulG
MSTGLIIAIVVVVLILLALAFLLPRMRANNARRKAQQELESRRERAAEQHRVEASNRESAADEAEQRARMAQAAAEKERAEANLQNQRATMHERGLADEEIVDPDERDRFADVSGGTIDRDGDGHTADDRARDAVTPDRDDTDDSAAARSEYQQGRVDERRDRITDDVRDSERR